MEIQNVCWKCWQKYWKIWFKQIWANKTNCDICWKYTYCAAPRDFDYLPDLPKKHKKPKMEVISQDELWEMFWGSELSAWMKYCSTKPNDSDRQKERDEFKHLYSSWKLW